MKIDTLRLKGLTRFEQEVMLDFRQVPGGVIAIRGDNGEGKTTVMESMYAAHWGSMPSRPDRSLTDLVNNARDAFIEVTSSFDDGTTMLSRINIDGMRRVTDAILQMSRGNQTQRTDGKVSTHKAAIAQALPPRETILASSFAAQGKQGSFSSMDRKGRKDLFSKLLHLEKYEDYAETARAAALTLDRRRAELQAQIDVLAPMTTKEQGEALYAEADRLQGDLYDTQNQAETAAERIALQAQQVDEAVAALAAFAPERERLAGAVERSRHLTLQVDQLVRELDTSREQHYRHRSTIERAAYRAMQAIEASLKALPSDEDLVNTLEQAWDSVVADYDTICLELNNKIANNQALMARADEIRRGVALLETLEADIAQVEQTVAEAEREYETTTGALVTAQALKSEYASAPHKLADVERDAKALTQVPFGQKCADAKCQFVTRAVQAREEIPAAQEALRIYGEATFAADNATQAVSDARALVTVHQQQLRKLRSQHAGQQQARVFAERLAHTEERLKELEQERERADADVALQKQWVDREGQERQQARHRDQARLTAEQTEVGERLAAELADLDARWAASEQALKTRGAEAVRERATADADILALTETLANTSDAEAELTRRQDLLRGTREVQGVMQAKTARLEAQLAAFTARRQEFRTRLADRERLEAGVEVVETDQIDWQVLGRIFGREGLPVLEIDAAGPQVSAIANDLLQSCFDGRFAVELVTQEARADGKGLKETFDIHIWDGEHGGDARDLSDLSGGEQVIVDEAIKSALAILINSRNTMPIRTCWRDETAGALDPANAQRYFLMLRRLRERGGFHHLFIIAHNPELTAQADAQVVCKDGTATLVFPPFSTQEAA